MDAPSTTAAFIVGQLNSYYGAGTYTYDSYVDPSTGGTGGGPSGLIYNTHSVMVISETNLAYSGSGAARAPMRYALQPVGGASSSKFYVYVSHMKSSSSTANVNRRNVEAQEIRADSSTLGVARMSSILATSMAIRQNRTTLR